MEPTEVRDLPRACPKPCPLERRAFPLWELSDSGGAGGQVPVPSSQELSGAARSYPKSPGPVGSRQELSGTVRSYLEPPGASRQELSDADRSYP